MLEFMADNDYKAEIKRLGIPDRLIGHGNPPELQREAGYDAAAIASAVRGDASQ